MTNTKLNSGYIALMSAIVISLILLVLCTSVSLITFISRFNILGVQNKAQSSFLAESCTNLVLQRLSQNVSYSYPNTENINLNSDSCSITEVVGNGSQRVIKTQAKFYKAYTNLEHNMVSKTWREY